MTRSKQLAVTAAAVVAATSLAIVQAQNPPKPGGSHERRVKEADVPAAALSAIKKLSGATPLAEFEEETKNGQKIYEAEWRTAGGHMEAAVTEAGDLIEQEESVAGDAVPKAAVAAAQATAGDKTPLRWVKKTFVVYEVQFKKDNKHHEVLLNAAGQSSGCDDEDGDDDDDGPDDDD